MTNKNNKLIIFSSLGLVIIIAVAVAAFSSNNDNINKNSQSLSSSSFSSQLSSSSDTFVSSESSLSVSSSITSQNSNFKNGDYVAIGEYTSPAGSEEIEVKVRIEDGKIVSVDTSSPSTVPQSKQYQELFSQGITKEVVGKNVEDLEVGKINGSSLTGAGFNQAISKILEEAGN